MLSPKDIPESCNKVLGDTHGERINTMILDILEQSFGKPEISMSEPVKEQFHILRSFMFDKVYLNPRAKGEEKRASSSWSSSSLTISTMWICCRTSF